MRITEKTRTSKVLSLLTIDNIRELTERDDIQPVPFSDKSIISMTIEEFADVTDENSVIEMLLKEEYFLDFIGKLKDYKQQLTAITEYMKRFELKQTKEEKAASVGIEFPTLIQSMLIRCCTFFRLHSFQEAQMCKIADYLLILQNDYATNKFQRNYQKIIENNRRK